MQNSYTNKIVLVTGGTSGIGKTTAIAFADAGARVVLTGRREKEGLEVVAEIKKTGGTVAYIRTDVAKEADVVKAVDFVLSTHGRLDVAFNNAGVEIVGPLDQVTEEQYRRTFDINVWGVLNAMKHEVAAMLKSGGGSIVNVSSIAGHIGLAQASIYWQSTVDGPLLNRDDQASAKRSVHVHAFDYSGTRCRTGKISRRNHPRRRFVGDGCRNGSPSGLRDRAPGAQVKPGALAPDFMLPDAQGRCVRLQTLLRQGPVVLVFYRGGWCPYCNLHL
jgi:NAD(P)-dependent dehydrogenase (short-subunit alcohol dehydrogenase family)